MKHLIQDALLAVLTVLLAHALTYWFVTALPDASIAALGVFAADHQQAASFKLQNPTPSYHEVLMNTFGGNLGKTLDGSSVFREVVDASAKSLPIVVVALLASILVCVCVAFLPLTHIQAATITGEVIAFLPPFVGPSIALVTSIFLTTFLSGAVLVGADWLLLAAGIALPCIAVAAAQASRITAKNLQQPFTIMMRACGLPELRIRVLLLRNLAVEIAPSLEQIAVVLITSLLLAEVIFGTSGLGSLTARAIRRSDMQLLLALTLVYSCGIAAIRMLRGRLLAVILAVRR